MSDLIAYVTCVKSVWGGGGGGRKEIRERGFCAFFPSPPLFCSCYVGLCLMRSYQQSQVMTAWTDQMHMLEDLHNILKDIIILKVNFMYHRQLFWFVQLKCRAVVKGGEGFPLGYCDPCLLSLKNR